MAISEEGFIDRLIGEEIKRVIADAKLDGGMISTGECIAQILRAYGGSSLSEIEITDRIIIAASKAGVAVEIGRPMSFDKSVSLDHG
jgi:hypothetical protein